MNSSGNYIAAAAITTIITVHKEMDLIWKKEKVDDDEINIKTEAEVKKKEEKWKKKMTKVL